MTLASDVAPEIPLKLRQLMAELGPRWLENTAVHVRQMTEAFSGVHRDGNREKQIERRDIAYGAHPRQVLDVYLPKTGGTGRTAMIFVHGGAFTEGHRNRTDEVYGNVLRYVARHGIVGVNIGYRLADDAQFPEATHDIAAAVAWTQEHAGELGIDPERMFLMGHSAGGAHVASYAYDKRWQPARGHGLAGVIIVSGRVRADSLPENTNARRVEAYYGTDSSTYDDASGVTHVAADSPPTFVAWSQYENALIDVYCTELVWRLGIAKRRAPPICYCLGHNHTSIIAHIDTAEDVLGLAIRKFISATLLGT
jgi:acetyl esterase